ncbi:hypothetical protein [Streptacidiphilus jiangxiensis]|uniref:Uncharacterized protein n=1 Tax=Streptacidiphilus jiangxiensis TaxID=235985 RepID=A0A1H7P527_STRJI|nr:hypothetical protein [Streptacidiphilus jiangxiensis]SEL30679.1 hypothetical protein SAMN05414137_107219 [Streptacidiphilus jiangxiensis]
MNAEPALYTIRVQGHLGAIALSAFPSLTAQYEAAHTVLVGQLDRSGLYGVLSQLEMLGLDLVSLNRVRARPAELPDQAANKGS